MFSFILLSICAYFLGSVNFAILLCSIWGYQDPRVVGSMNPGATNVLRTASPQIAAAVLILDGFKGWLPVFVASFVLTSKFSLAFVGFFALLGHLYPVFFNFNGGKGIATFIGILLALFYPAAIIFCSIWLLIAATTKYSSLSSIIAVATTPVYLLMLYELDIILPILAMSIFLLWRHHDNIMRLHDGNESQIKFK
ncbi:MAG: glycerol-3-phosphate 1-O-acyltransferase PlsY [Gammaproteobacteria bacterium]|nr:glycerol-3-phosphate 1-O-acyltransferase PlsY [Gammaproteobacteria bacterium]